jgi:hypothetical protein
VPRIPLPERRFAAFGTWDPRRFRRASRGSGRHAPAPERRRAGKFPRARIRNRPSRVKAA